MSKTSRVAIQDYSTYFEIERAIELGFEVFNFKQLISFGALSRRRARAFFELNDICYYEIKGLLSSEFVVTVNSKRKVFALAQFTCHMDMLNSLLAVADDKIEERAQVIKKNKFRKLVFRSPLPVPYDGMSRDDIARTFMAK